MIKLQDFEKNQNIETYELTAEDLSEIVV